MIFKAISSDFLKIRGKGIWFLVFLGPIGLIAMQSLNYGLRYDYLIQQYSDDLWGALIDNILVFVPIALYLGITVVCSLLANIEHHMSSWKQLLALPISRSTVFWAKFIVCALLLSLSCLLLAAGTVTLGLLLGFGVEALPAADIASLSIYPYLASMPVLALMLWLCMTYRNQTFAVFLGVVMAVFSVVSISEWLPINWPLLSYQGPGQELFAGAGLLGGLLILAIGHIHFGRKDVD